jgi:NADH:ubiquinone oxidoreductase subunit 6 (subunit J)
MSWFLFALAAFFVLGGAIGVVATRNVVWAALFLLVSLASAAGVYLLLYAEFLALVQVLIYGGAIIIVLLFAIMLTRSSEYPRISDNRQWPLAILAAGGLFAVIAVAFLWKDAPDAGPTGPGLAKLGETLFTDWALPFEVASLVLLVALIGAIIIAKTGGRD